MHCFATPAHCLPIAITATFPRWETAVVLCVPGGEDGVTTHTAVLIICADVPAHVATTATTLVRVPTGSRLYPQVPFTILVTSSMTGF